jgi:type II secretion system (T2SS) protein E
LAIDRRTTQKRLSDVLVDEGVLTKAQVTEASKYLRQPDDPLGPHLIRCGFITAWDLAKAVCTHFSLPFYDFTTFKPKKDVVLLLDPPFLHGYGVLPIDKFGKIVTLAVCESLSPTVLQTIVDRTQLSPYMYVAPYDKIRERLEEACPYEAPAAQPEAAAAAAAPDAEPGEPASGDWMTIFEEAEKKMKGSDSDVELTKGSGKSEEDEAAT